MKHSYWLIKVINSLSSRARLLLSGSIAISLYFLTLPGFVFSAHWMITWLGFCLSHLLFSWSTIWTCSPDQIRRSARKQDSGRAAISVFMLFAAMASFVALAILMTSTKGLGKNGQTVHIILAVASLISAWLLIHTNFVFRYAHLYYSGIHGRRDTTGGLSFPEEEEPDYLDFTYFTFIIATTFQVADVAVTSKRIRRVVCLHGILSFAFNTIILALSINILSGIVQQ